MTQRSAQGCVRREASESAPSHVELPEVYMMPEVDGKTVRSSFVRTRLWSFV